MKLTAIQKLTGVLELVSGLHIGSGNTEMHIGGTDNPVIKHPLTLEPYIPGSSIKGKIRSLLEWELGVIGLTEGKPLGFKDIGKLKGAEQDQAKDILRLFGGAPEGNSTSDALVREIGPTRLAFWDCPLDKTWVGDMQNRNLLLTETKTENMIDRIKGVAETPPQHRAGAGRGEVRFFADPAHPRRRKPAAHPLAGPQAARTHGPWRIRFAGLWKGPVRPAGTRRPGPAAGNREGPVQPVGRAVGRASALQLPPGATMPYCDLRKGRYSAHGMPTPSPR